MFNIFIYPFKMFKIILILNSKCYIYYNLNGKYKQTYPFHLNPIFVKFHNKIYQLLWLLQNTLLAIITWFENK